MPGAGSRVGARALDALGVVEWRQGLDGPLADELELCRSLAGALVVSPDPATPPERPVILWVLGVERDDAFTWRLLTDAVGVLSKEPDLRHIITLPPESELPDAARAALPADCLVEDAPAPCDARWLESAMRNADPDVVVTVGDLQVAQAVAAQPEATYAWIGWHDPEVLRAALLDPPRSSQPQMQALVQLSSKPGKPGQTPLEGVGVPALGDGDVAWADVIQEALARWTPAPTAATPRAASRFPFIPVKPPTVSASVARSPAPSVRIVTHPGLGDALLAVTVAYAYAEHGYVPSVGLHSPEGYSHRTTTPLVNSLPTLPLLGHGAADKDLDISGLHAFDWVADTDMPEALCAELGVEVVSTPRQATLWPEPWYADTARGLAGTSRYVLVAPRGHYMADTKEMQGAQVAAAARAAQVQGLATVIVHSEPLVAAPPETVNLSGQLSLRQLCALTACAAAVVSTDTGVLHLAGAFGVPILGVLPHSTVPRGVLRHYAPRVLLEGATSADVDPADVATGLTRLLLACREPWYVLGPDRRACGVAAHARAISAAAGVDWRSTPGDTGFCIANHHPNTPRDLAGLLPSHTVVDAHHIDGLDAKEWGGVVVHSAPFYRALRGTNRRTWYVPLACDEMREDITLPQQPRTIVWHGIVTASKGLEQMVAAIAETRIHVPDACLRLIGSTGNEIADRDLASRLAATPVSGVEVRLKDYWSPSDLNAELRRADVFCYMDTNNAEQSACSPQAMGYARPVVVSRSTKHDDVRGWTVTAGADLGSALVRLLTDRRAYADAAVRAWQGASYRRLGIVARQYRGAVQQAMLDCPCTACTSTITK